MQNNVYPRGAKAITPGSTQLSPALCGLVASTACTATVTDELGNSTTVTLAAGVPFYCSITEVTAVSTGSVVGLLP